MGSAGHILVFLQSQDGVLPKISLIALSAAAQLKSKWGGSGVSGIVLGKGAAKAADEALAYGLEKVYFSEAAAFEKYLSVPYTAAVVQAFSKGNCSIFVSAATSAGKDFAPRVAAALDAGQASDIVGVNDDGTLKRPMYAGDVIADVEIVTQKKVITVRGTAFPPAAKGSVCGSKEEIQVSFDSALAGEVVGYELSKGGRPELSDAEIVVSGGRALQSAENFEKYIFPLADVLGAAVGASRAAVDSGYAPNDWQVGQTGKVVAPSLYIAVGISGAIQHLAGMKDSKVICAINKDGDAPIFEVADYGLVADLYQAVPALIDALRKAKSA